MSAADWYIKTFAWDCVFSFIKIHQNWYESFFSFSNAVHANWGYFMSSKLFGQVILYEIDWAIFYTNLHELFCKFISWTNWGNFDKFMDNWWISCQVMADMKNFNETKYTVSGKCLNVSVSCTHLFNSSGPTSTRIFLKLRSNNAMHKIRGLEKKLACKKQAWQEVKVKIS